MNADELFAAVAALPSAQAVPTNGSPLKEGSIVAGVEISHSSVIDERKLRSAWKRRHGGGAKPLFLIVDDPENAGVLRVLGPNEADGPIRSVSAESLLDAIQQASTMPELEAVRELAQQVDRLDQTGVAGLTVRGLGTQHLYARRLPAQDRWAELAEIAQDVKGHDWRDTLSELGYQLDKRRDRGYVARANGTPTCVIHPRKAATEFARLDDKGRPPEGLLLNDCEIEGAPYGLLAAGTRMRLFSADPESGSAASSYLELDADALTPEQRPLLGLLGPTYLAQGAFGDLMVEARDYGAALRERVDRALRQQVLPILGLELGRWAAAEGMDAAKDEVRQELEQATLTFAFRALFLLYAESAGYLPMANGTYAEQSFTRTIALAYEGADRLDPSASGLWLRIEAIVDAMRTGNSAWGVPPYNGALFAEDGFEGAETLERARINDAALGPALVALGRDPEADDAGIDFSDLAIGHLGHIYEGLLSLRLSVADRDYRYDARKDRYVPVEDPGEIEVAEGELLWLTNEGGRKGGGVYYTPEPLVQHLVRGAVVNAFKKHLSRVATVAADDPNSAASELFDFNVLDPACGSAHFLVAVVDELADLVAGFLGDHPLPAVGEELGRLRAAAERSYGSTIEDVALLRRLVLKRCVYGVDVSAMGAEIAKVSLWLASFVPGLSLTYLDNNVQVGNSLIGVGRPEVVRPPGEEHGQIVMFGEELEAAVRAGATAGAKLEAIKDVTPEDIEQSKAAHEEARAAVERAELLYDLWTAEPLGLEGAREEVWQNGKAIIEGKESVLADDALQTAQELRFLHWPLAFPEVFARDRPGFDAVVGNPPWEEVTVEELAFYARYAPGLRGMSADARNAALAELKEERPELPHELNAEQERLTLLRQFLGRAGGYAGSPGDPDMYKFFCQRYRDLLRDEGVLAVVLPRTAFMAKGSADFRRWLHQQAEVERLDFAVNTKSWMFDTSTRYTVALLIARRALPGRAQAIEAAGVAGSPQEFEVQRVRPGIRLAPHALGPDLEVPLLEDQASADLLAKLRNGGGPFPLGAAGRWRCFPVAEFHETNDRKLWDGAKDGWPLWKGESFDQFDPHGAEARRCPPSKAALKKARKPRPGGGSLLAEQHSTAQRAAAVAAELGRARVTFRDVSRGRDPRTVIACLVPPETFLTNKAPYLAFLEGDERARAVCLAAMNSLVFDWQARRFVEINLNFFILELLRLPAIDDSTYDNLAMCSARLACPDERFSDFAAAVGVDYGPIDDEERERLRVEIDALIAKQCQLGHDELELVLGDFTTYAVPDSYRENLRARFAELTA